MVSIKRLTMAALFIISGFSWADVTARVDRTEVYDDESLMLTVTVSPIAELEQDDLTALQTLFEITQNFHQQSTQIINGRRSSKVDYQFRLRPKQTGTLAIPNFHVGQQQSQPIFISVLDSTQRQDGLADDAVTLQATLSQSNPYVDQAILLTVELQSKVNFAQGATISDVQADGFDIAVLDNKNFTRNQGQSSVSVYQRIFQLTPKTAGAFKLPDIRFSAQYPNRQLGRYVPLTRVAKIPAIEVRPIPANYPAGAFWLPATGLRITDNLSANLSTSTNEHLEWQRTAIIDGLDAHRLPDLFANIDQQLTNGIKHYKNNPTISNTERTDSVALVFNQAGQITLPELRIPWWNITTDQLEWATIDERTVTVVPGAHSQPTIQPEATLTQSNPDLNIATAPGSNDSRIWQYATLFFAFLWLATLTLYMKNRLAAQTKQPTNSPIVKQPKRKVPESPNEIYQAVFNELSKGQDRNQLPDTHVRTLNQLETFLFKQGKQPTKDELTALLKAVTKLSKGNNAAQGDSSFNLYPG